MVTERAVVVEEHSRTLWRQGGGRPSAHRDTGRLVAFSDAVFAITITLLVLEIRPPTDYGNLLHGLVALWPSYLAYAVTFLFIGQVWANHHVMFDHIRAADRVVLLVNTLLLMAVAFLPFATSVLAGALRSGDGQRTAVVFYGIAFWVTAARLPIRSRLPGTHAQCSGHDPRVSPTAVSANRANPFCGRCGTEIPRGVRFCPGCGEPVADDAAAKQRKLATVLFADLVGSTAFSGRALADRAGCPPLETVLETRDAQRALVTEDCGFSCLVGRRTRVRMRVRSCLHDLPLVAVRFSFNSWSLQEVSAERSLLPAFHATFNPLLRNSPARAPR
jgi:uncharacterized membrane protein